MRLAFKAKVALAAMKGDRTLAELAEHARRPMAMPSRWSVHPPSGARLRDEARIRPDSTDAEGQDVQRRRGRHCASAAG